jgi:hypothetical protein
VPQFAGYLIAVVGKIWKFVAHNLFSIGHWALGIGHWALGIGNCSSSITYSGSQLDILRPINPVSVGAVPPCPPRPGFSAIH